MSGFRPQAGIGDLLLPAAAPAAEREEWCDCLLESRGVLAQIREKLGDVVDTGRGVDKIVAGLIWI